jgi:hypothetical protein
MGRDYRNFLLRGNDMDYRELEADRNKILLGLVKFYYESGYTSSAYMDPETGGIYEHKLANILGYRLTQDNQPPPEFVAATKLLEEQGCVRRMRRNPNITTMGVWPTSKGLEEIENLRAPYAPRVSNNSSPQKVGILKKIWNDSVFSNAIYDMLKWAFFLVVGVLVWYFTNWWPFNRDIPQKKAPTSQSEVAKPETTKFFTVNTKIEDQEKVFLREKSPGELINYLTNLPPLQREIVIEDSYIGRWVQWDGKVSSITTLPSKNININVSKDGEGASASLLFSTSWREKIENLRIDDLIIYSGRIDSVINNHIKITESSFEMAKSNKQQ